MLMVDMLVGLLWCSCCPMQGQLSSEGGNVKSMFHTNHKSSSQRGMFPCALIKPRAVYAAAGSLGLQLQEPINSRLNHGREYCAALHVTCYKPIAAATWSSKKLFRCLCSEIGIGAAQCIGRNLSADGAYAAYDGVRQISQAFAVLLVRSACLGICLLALSLLQQATTRGDCRSTADNFYRKPENMNDLAERRPEHCVHAAAGNLKIQDYRG